jgi:hypothetical protein
VLQGCCKVLHKYGADWVQRGPTGVAPPGHTGATKSLQISGFLGPKAEGRDSNPRWTVKAHNGFRDRPEYLASPLMERSQVPRGNARGNEICDQCSLARGRIPLEGEARSVSADKTATHPTPWRFERSTWRLLGRESDSAGAPKSASAPPRRSTSVRALDRRARVSDWLRALVGADRQRHAGT